MTRAYYNEYDPKAAAWLRELIAEGLIADGDVDTRSITDVPPGDLAGYTQCHFFAGIGGWSRALRLADWPDDRPVWTGSCPCQPFSVAGAGGGTDDERHLWPAFRWLIAKCRPATVFGEQVASADGRQWLAGVCDDLEAMGYLAGAADLCAAGVGAPHIRQRLWWVADGTGAGLEGGKRPGQRANAQRAAVERGSEAVDWSRSVWWPCRDGKWRRVPARRVGNADEPQQDIHAEIGGSREATGERSRFGRLGNEQSRGCGERRNASLPGRGGHADGTEQDGGMADASVWRKCGEPGCSGEGNGAGSQGRNVSPDSAVPFVVTGHDGLEIEPALFPLADGVPGRVGLLRGAGNAIVPQVAAQFIEACKEMIV